MTQDDFVSKTYGKEEDFPVGGVKEGREEKKKEERKEGRRKWGREIRKDDLS